MDVNAFPVTAELIRLDSAELHIGERRSMIEAAPLRVLQSFSRSEAADDPYMVMLFQSLEATAAVEPIHFSWKIRPHWQYTAFHVHWPESLIERRGWVSTAGRRILYLVLLLRLRLLGIPIVRTVHDIDLPSGISRYDTAVLRLTDRWTAMRIVLNPFTPLPEGAASVLIEHGDYREWFADMRKAAQFPGATSSSEDPPLEERRQLVHAFVQLPQDEPVSLKVAGKPSSDELARSLRDLSLSDPRVDLELDFLDDPAVVQGVGEAELVVLPAPDMHNPGRCLRRSHSTAGVGTGQADQPSLQQEVGEGWVVCFEGELDSRVLQDALRTVRSAPARLSREPRPAHLGARRHPPCPRLPTDDRADVPPSTLVKIVVLLSNVPISPDEGGP